MREHRLASLPELGGQFGRTRSLRQRRGRKVQRTQYIERSLEIAIERLEVVERLFLFGQKLFHRVHIGELETLAEQRAIEVESAGSRKGHEVAEQRGGGPLDVEDA